MKFEVPQRQQLASERTSLTLFAPAPSTISFVPLTRNLSPADPSPTRGWTGLSEATATRFSVLRTTKCDAFSEARRTKNRLLRYGIRIRCSKRLPVVRDASSEAFGVKNRLFWYGRDTRYRKRPSGVPNASSEAFGVKNRLLRYGRDIRYQKQAPVVRDAFSETFGDKKGLLWYATHLQRCAKQPPAPPNAFSKAQKRHPVTPNASSKARRTADSTDCGQPPAAPDASSVRETAPARR